FFFSSRRRHTRLVSDWSSDVCSSDLTSGVPQYMPSAIQDRPLPGEGVVDIPGILEALSDIGAHPFFAAEVFNADMALRGPESMRSEERRVGKGGGDGW